LTEESQTGGLFLWFTTCQMHELALQYMQWQRQAEGVGFKLLFQTLGFKPSLI